MVPNFIFYCCCGHFLKSDYNVTNWRRAFIFTLTKKSSHLLHLYFLVILSSWLVQHSSTGNELHLDNFVFLTFILSPVYKMLTRNARPDFDYFIRLIILFIDLFFNSLSLPSHPEIFAVLVHSLKCFSYIFFAPKSYVLAMFVLRTVDLLQVLVRGLGTSILDFITHFCFASPQEFFQPSKRASQLLLSSSSPFFASLFIVICSNP